MCGLVVDGKRPDRCPSCGTARLTQLTGQERGAVSDTATQILEWDPEALARVERTPEGFLRTMTSCRIEHWARSHSKSRVSLEVVESKLRNWEEGGSDFAPELRWSEEALARAGKIPLFIRPRVMLEIERQAASWAKHQVDGALIDEVLQDWKRTLSFHSREP